MIPLSIKLPAVGSVKAPRGMTGDVVFGVINYDLTAVGAVALFLTPIDVVPGKETTAPVTITPLPPNASIERIVARLAVNDADSSPAQAAVGVSIEKNNDAKDPASGSFQIAVDEPVRPRNVQLKLKDGDVFWSFGGVLTEASYDLPDFASALNAYLDTAQFDAAVTELPLVIKSDAPGKVGIDITELTYSQVKTQAWANPLDGTTRVDRNVAVDFGTVEQVPLDALTEQAGRVVQLRSLRMDVGGRFGPDRLLGEIEPHDGRQFATISADYTLAQSFIVSGKLIPGPRSCTGITCFFVGGDKAELYVELQKDANGYPAADPPLAKASLMFTPPEKSGHMPWTFARFSAPAELRTDIPYWVVIKGVRGAVRLGLQVTSNGDDSALPVLRNTMYINRGGQLWKSMFRPTPVPRIVAMCGVVYQPGSDDQTAAVQISATGAPESSDPVGERIDPDKAPRTISLNVKPDVGWNHLLLEVRSNAQGTLSIANVIREYRLA